jgi:hypothetical protein
MTLCVIQVNPSFAGVNVREFMIGSELLNHGGFQSTQATLKVHGDDLLSHLLGIGAPTIRSMAMIGDTGAIGWPVSSIHDDVMDVCGGGVDDGHVTCTTKYCGAICSFLERITLAPSDLFQIKKSYWSGNCSTFISSVIDLPLLYV